jgi:hypothetical protein
MGTGVVRAIAFVCLFAAALRGDGGSPSPSQPLEVAVYKTSGLAGDLTPGLRVDALFLAAGPDGGPAKPRQFLLAVRNVEVIGTVRVSGGSPIRQRTTLRLSEEDARTVQDLPANVTEIVAVRTPTRARTLFESYTADPLPDSVRRRSASEAFDESAVPADDPIDRNWDVSSSRKASWPEIWRGLLWFVLTCLVAACCMQVYLAPRRRLVRKAKRGARYPWRQSGA